MKKLLTVLLIILITCGAIAFTVDEAINYASKTNHYLLDGERAALLEPKVTITHDEVEYWIVIGQSGTTTNIYLPLNNEEEKLAEGEIVLRKLIKTSIVLNKIYNLKNSYPVNDWSFSYSNQTKFYDLKNSFSQKILSVRSFANEIEKENTDELIEQAQTVEDKLKEINEKSKEIAEIIGTVIEFEKKFFSKPNTKHTNDYKKYFEDYFSLVAEYKSIYNVLETELQELQNKIATSNKISSSKKSFYLKNLSMPTITSTLPSFFNTNDSTKTFVEEIFNSTNNIENFVANLETRKERNKAWKVLYGENKEIAEINSSFNTLEDAAKSILDEKNIDYWKNQDSVSALKTNWSQAKSKFENGIYNKAREFGQDAEENVKSVLKKGYNEEKSNIPEGLIIQIVIILIITIIGLFLFEKFYLKKENKDKMEYEGDYNEMQ